MKKKQGKNLQEIPREIPKGISKCIPSEIRQGIPD